MTFEQDITIRWIQLGRNFYIVKPFTHEGKTGVLIQPLATHDPDAKQNVIGVDGRSDVLVTFEDENVALAFCDRVMGAIGKGAPTALPPLRFSGIIDPDVERTIRAVEQAVAFAKSPDESTRLRAAQAENEAVSGILRLAQRLETG